MALTYIGAGRWLPGIPSRDLDDADVAALGIVEADLIAGGLYTAAAAPARARAATATTESVESAPAEAPQGGN